EEIARRRADAVVAARYARRPWAGVVAAAARLTVVRPPGTVEFGQAVGELRRLVELAEADHAAEIVRAREEACASLFADDLGPHRTVVEGMGGGVERTAAISLCGRYRYRLGRTWGTGGKRCVFVMLNPST